MLLLCATVYAQLAALADSHKPHLQNDRCCLLCHSGVLPFLQADSDISTAPTATVEWLPRNPDRLLFHDAFLVSRSSRAPPRPTLDSAV